MAAVLLSAGTAHGSEPALDRWSGPVAEAARRFGIPEDWIRSVMRLESAGRTELNGRPIVSPAGAMGLMQLMPGTWSAMRDRYGLGRDPFDPHDNILAGAAYLHELYTKFGFPGLFAAYNAGPGRYGAFRDAGMPLPGETRSYVAALTGSSVVEPSAPLRGGALFFTLGHSSHASRSTVTPSANGLFVAMGAY